MFAKQRHPGADPGWHQVHRLRGPDAGPGQFNFARVKADGQPVGFPEPELFQGATGKKINALRATYGTINTSYYSPFVNANENGVGEPLDAQAVYTRSTRSCWPCSPSRTPTSRRC